MKPTDLSVASFQVLAGETRYTFPVPPGAVVDVCIRSDKPFRLYVSSDKHGRVCVGPGQDGDLAFDGRFRMVEGERFDIHTMKSATVGVRISDQAARAREVPDPNPVEVPVFAQMSLEQKIAREVERRIRGDQVDQAVRPGWLLEDEEPDWDDWSPYMEMEDERPQPTPSHEEQGGEAAPVPPAEGQGPKQQAPATAGGKGMAEQVDGSNNSE